MDTPNIFILACIKDLNSYSRSKRNEGISRLTTFLVGHDIKIYQSVETSTWTKVIISIHTILLSEMDQYCGPKDKTAAAVKCEEILSTINGKICSGHVTIIVKRVLACVLTILKHSHHRVIYGNLYFQIALTLLNIKKHLMAIGSSLLKELADSCMVILKDPVVLPIEEQALNVLNIIARHSSHDSQVEFHLKIKFPFLFELFQKKSTAPLKQKMMIELAVIFCIQFGKECRTEACKFGENVVMDVLQCAIFKPNTSGMALQSLFLYMQMILHHPYGIKMNEPGFYAHDANMWEEILKQLFEHLCDRVEEISHLKPHSLEQFFVKFAASICNQVFDRHDQAEPNEEFSVPEKKRKLRATGIILLDVANDMKKKWPWIQVLSEVQTLSQNTIRKNDYVPLLKLLLELLSTNKDMVLMDHICGFIKTLLKMEKSIDPDETLAEELNKVWSAISATIIRIVGLNQNEASSHSLLQQLLVCNKVDQPGNLMAIFLQGIRFSEASVKTWTVLFSHFNLFDSHDPQGRCNKNYFGCLLLWLSPFIKSKDISIPLVAPQSISNAYLALLCNEAISKNTYLKYDTPACSRSIFEDVLMWSYLQVSCVIENDDSEKVEPLRKGIPKECNPKDRDLLIETLNQDSSAVMDLMCNAHGNKLEHYKIFIHHMMILATTLSNMVECHILEPDGESITSLQASLNNMVVKAADYASSYINRNYPPEDQDELIDFYGVLDSIFTAKLVPSVLSIIQQQGFTSLITHILELIFSKVPQNIPEGFDFQLEMSDELRNISEEEYYKDLYRSLRFGDSTFMDHLEPLTRKPNMQVFHVALIAATSFASNVAEGCSLSNEQIEFITKILQFFKSADMQEYLGIVLHMVKKLLTCASLTSQHLEDILFLLRCACNEMCYCDVNVATLVHICLIEVLRYANVRDVQVKIMMFLKIIHKRICWKESVGRKAVLQFLKLLMETIKVDPHCSWSVCDAPPYQDDANNSSEEHIYPFFSHALKYLNNKDQEVRMEATKCLSIMFAPNGIERNIQKWLFKKLCEELLNIFKIKDVPHDFQSLDEKTNRTAVLLHSWSSIVVITPFFRKKALFSILRVEKEYSINISAMQKVILLIAKQLKLQSIEEMFVVMKQQLSYMVTWWLYLDYDLKDFRWMLFGFNSKEEFFSEQVKILLPLLMQRKNKFDTILALFDKPVSELIKSNCVYLMASCLPLMTKDAENSKCSLLMAIEDVEYVKEHIMSALSVEEVKEMFKKSHIMLAEVLNLLDDPEHFLTLCGSCEIMLPEPELPHCNIKTIENVMNLLQEKSPNKQENMIISWSVSKLSYIENLLSMLEARIQEMILIEDKIKCLLQYCTYVNMLAICFNSHSGQLPRDNACYIIQIVTYRFLHLINAGPSIGMPVAAAACCYYIQFCNKMVTRYPDFVGKLMNFVVSRVIPLVNMSSDISTHAVKLLNLLIVEHELSLTEYIARLDPIPKLEVLNPVRAVQEKYAEETSLMKTINNFLENEQHRNYRVEALKHLRIQLKERKDELLNMYDALNTMHGFSEEHAKCGINGLISTLVQLSQSPCFEVKIEATKCLGELGPANLGIVVLQPDSTLRSFQLQSEFNIKYKFTYQTVTSLREYLLDSNIQALQVASLVLYALVNTSNGRTLLNSAEYKNDTVKRCILLPYLDMEKKHFPLTFSASLFQKEVYDLEIWCPQRATSHEQWITKLMNKLLSCFNSPDNCVTLLRQMCKIKVSFAESILPYVLMLIRSECDDSCWGKIIESIRHFFEMYFRSNISADGDELERKMLTAEFSAEHTPQEVISEDGPTSSRQVDVERTSGVGTNNEEMVHSNIASVKCMLTTVQCLYFHDMENSKGAQLNYITVAQAALSCSSYFTALQYAERWCIKELREMKSNKMMVKLNVSQSLNQMKERNKTYGMVVDYILKQANANIGDPDAWHGCGRSHLQSPEGRRYHYEMKGEWDNVLLSCEPKLLPFKKNVIQEAYWHCLEHLGMFSLLYTSSSRTEDGFDKHAYECLWRMGDWSQLGYCSKKRVETTIIKGEINEYEELHYHALKCVKELNLDLTRKSLLKTREFVTSQLKHANTESCQNLYEPLSKVQLLNEIEDFINAIEEDSLVNLCEKWEMNHLHRGTEVKYLEPLLSQRVALLKMILDKEENYSMKKRLSRLLAEIHLDLAKTAHQEGCFSLAERQINCLHYSPDIPEYVMLNARLEEAELFWDKGQKDIGLYLLQKLISDVEKPSENLTDFECIHMSSRKRLGDWLVETGTENTQIIISEYYQKALKLMERQPNPAIKGSAYLSLARFADAKYQDHVNYMNSAEFSVKKTLLEKAKSKTALLAQDASKAYAIHLNERMIAYSGREMKEIEEERFMYLELSLRSYLQSLKLNNGNGLHVFRFVSLWLENKNDERLKSVIEEHLFKVPLHLFLPVLPQLIPHLNEDTSMLFTRAITAIIECCGKLHPYHVLPLIIAVSNLGMDEKYISMPTNSARLQPRINGAKAVIRRLQHIEQLQGTVSQMEEVMSALIELAYCKGDRNKPSSIPEHILRRLQNKDKVPVLTEEIPVKQNADYSNVVGIAGYDRFYSLCSGLHEPKKVVCRGTDGKRRVQLVKGADDLRQDAVMMQVFSIMNRLILENKETQKRKLHIRTYKIVPCSQLSGVIQWCTNTVPLGQYLQNVHKTSFSTEKKEMEKVSLKSTAERLKVFEQICCSVEPMLHKFFMDNFKTPSIWFQRRLAFTRSVAVTSMIGYILGIGDRHPYNLLLDQITGEIVHIDFGVAHEQGKLLRTPELVPFRLTREIEDGMGISGIEGVFRRCCEKTMEVMRANKKILYAIVEVILYDPLYTWILSPSKAQNVQGEIEEPSITCSLSEDVNMMAKIVLLKLQHKLQGTEEGAERTVAGQVNKIIQMARDPENLCRMFHGWKPFL